MKSKLFKDVCFYIDNKIRKCVSLDHIVHAIKENSGLPYATIIRRRKMYCILVDHPDTE